MIKYLIVINLMVTSVFAAGGYGSPADLIPSFFNVIAVGAILVFLLRKKFNAHFQDESNKIKGQLESAEIKAKEARIMLEEQKKKEKNLQDEIEKLNNEAVAGFKSIKSELEKENEVKIAKMKEDASLRLSSDKAEFESNLMSFMVNEIVSKVKSQNNNSETTKELSAKLLR